MKPEIQELIEISQFYGKRKDFVIAGGGNTSYKDENHIYIKASGHSLATIGEDGFAQLDRKGLQLIAGKTYSEDVMERENQIKNDLLNSRVHPEKGQRPSVETSLHDLIAFPFVVHTHSTKVNGLMCSAKRRTTDHCICLATPLFMCLMSIRDIFCLRKSKPASMPIKRSTRQRAESDFTAEPRHFRGSRHH